MKKINLELSLSEAKAVRKGLQSALLFWDTYYMFASYDTLNEGNAELDEQRRRMAHKVVGMIEELT